MPDNLTNGPSYTTPQVNPSDDLMSGINQSQGISTPKFEYAQNPATQEARVHGDLTRHPTNSRFTRQPRTPGAK